MTVAQFDFDANASLQITMKGGAEIFVLEGELINAGSEILKISDLSITVT